MKGWPRYPPLSVRASTGFPVQLKGKGGEKEKAGTVRYLDSGSFASCLCQILSRSAPAFARLRGGRGRKRERASGASLLDVLRLHFVIQAKRLLY